MSAALEIFAELGITYRERAARCQPGKAETHCCPLVDKLIREHGMPHARQVLLTFVDTINADQLRGAAILAVSDILLHHQRWRETGMAWLEAFDKISLRDIWTTTKATRFKAKREVISALLFVEIERLLGPSVPRRPAKPARPAPKPPAKVSRIPIIEQRVELGQRLLELKAKSRRSNDFSIRRKKQFPDLEPKLAMQAASVARRYGNRPEIFRRVGWRTLVQLAAPSLPSAARHRFEARILAGEDVKGIAIKRSRGRLPTGRPGRREPSAPRMAA